MHLLAVSSKPFEALEVLRPRTGEELLHFYLRLVVREAPSRHSVCRSLGWKELGILERLEKKLG